MPPLVSYLGTVPCELVEQITRSLSPPALRCLHGTARKVGDQPTSDFVSGLLLRLPASDCCQKELITDGLSHVATLSVQGSRLCDLPNNLNFLDAGLPALLRRVCPPMAALHTLILHNMGTGVVASAMPHVVAACPQLTCLKLLNIELDEQPLGRGLTVTLRALVALPALHRLKITLWCPNHEEEEGSISLAGIGAVTQLESLSLTRECGKMFALPLQDLSRLVGLRKLTLGCVDCIQQQSAASPAPHLGGLSRLQRVKVLNHEFAHYALGALTPLAACSGLTSVRVTGFDGDEVDGCEDSDEESEDDFARRWLSLQPHYSHLTRLELNATVNLACTDLEALPALRVLQCFSITLPPRGIPVSLPQLRAVKCTLFCRTKEDDTEAWLPAPPLAVVVPQLATLAWLGCVVLVHELFASPAELLLLAPEGHPTHLRRVILRHPQADFSSRLTGPVEELVLGPTPPHGRCILSGTTSVAGNTLAAMISLMTAVGATLRRVELSHSQVDDECLEALVAVWPRTEEVTLWGAAPGVNTHHVTDAGLAALGKLKGLRRVRLIRCSAVTPQGISTLVAQLSVEHVEVCGCAQVGRAEVARLHNTPSSDGACYGLRPSLHLTHSAVEGKAGPWWGVEEV